MAKRAIRSATRVAGRLRAGRFALTEALALAMQQRRAVTRGALTLWFATPNPLCELRARTFSSKEPETLEWIDTLPDGAALWDVGANVGLFTVYAAARGCRVWAFEPSVFNLELLARNVEANQLTDRVCLVPLALSDSLAASRMRLTSTEWGGARSTFGRDIGWDGQPMETAFEYQTVGLSMDDAVARLGLPAPDYIKMDVDGLEHFILHGGPRVLSTVRGVLIEVNDAFEEQASACRQLLAAAGLTLEAKRQSDLMANSDGYQATFNQIWRRA